MYAERVTGGQPAVVAVGYVRVSTVEQAESGAGLSAQRLAIEQEAARRNWQLLEIFTDTSSGRSLQGREALHAALEELEAGHAHVLVVAKLDRLSRSLLDFAGLMSRARTRGWNLVALDLGIDLSTPAGEFLASVMASAAQWERRIIGQRTKEALAVRRAAGARLGRPPQTSPEALARALELRADGLPLRAVAARLTAEGVPTARGGAWHASTIRALLSSQHALGVIDKGTLSEEKRP